MARRGTNDVRDNATFVNTNTNTNRIGSDRIGSDLPYGYGDVVLIYHSILNTFKSDLRYTLRVFGTLGSDRIGSDLSYLDRIGSLYGYGEVVLIYHSILNTLGSASGSIPIPDTRSTSKKNIDTVSRATTGIIPSPDMCTSTTGTTRHKRRT